MEELVDDPNSYLVQSPMCRFGMKLKNDEGELLHVRKETLWLTNSEEIAKFIGMYIWWVPIGQKLRRCTQWHWWKRCFEGSRESWRR